MVQEHCAPGGGELPPLERNMIMLYHLLLYRSLTRAQRASEILNRGDIPNTIVRVPREVSKEGCANGIRLDQGALYRSLTLLRTSGVEPRKVFVSAGDNHYEEVIF